MTIREAITRADAIEPNAFTEEEKVRWLAYIDGDLLLETILAHEHDGEVPNTNYSAEDLSQELLAPYPADEMYPYYLRMRINEANDEMGKYNNAASLFNPIYGDYIRRYHREHKPLGNSFKFR